jgi:uncharacterized protein involved in exopolysaccharide biosynthesis
VARDRDQKLFLQRQLELAQSNEDTSALSSSAAATAGTAATGVVAELARAEAALQAAEMRLTPEHPDVERARHQVQILRERAATEQGSGTTTVGGRRVNARARELVGQIELLDRQIAGRLEEERDLRGKIADYARRVDATPMRESELAALTRDYEDTKRLYSSLLQRQQEATMAADLERKEIGDRFRIIEPARLPEKPFSPSRRNYLAVGLLVSFFFSLGLAVVVEYRDSAMRTEEDIVAGLRLPVLATIPVLNRVPSGRSR